MGFTSDLFGSKPDVPAFNQLNLGTEQQTAITNNQNALPGAEKLAGSVDAFSRDQMTQMLEYAMPGFGAAKGKISGNILDLTEGKIPTDVSDMVKRSSNYRSLAGGFGGSQAAGNLTARDLGLTSLDLMGKGQDSMSRWLSMTEPKTFDVSSMFVSPTQQASFDVSERNAKWNHDWLQNQIDAMPDPGTTGWWNFGWSVVDGVLDAYTGGMAGASKSKLGQVSPGTTPQGGL